VPRWSAALALARAASLPRARPHLRRPRLLRTRAPLHRARADDPDLTRWVKAPRPWLAAPPDGMPYNCWRDPFVIERPRGANKRVGGRPGSEDTGSGGRWRVVIGSGVDDAPRADGGPGPRARGMALAYSAGRLADGGWELEARPLCEARSGEVDGRVWECPLVAWLDPLPQAAGGAGGITNDPAGGSSAAAASRGAPEAAAGTGAGAGRQGGPGAGRAPTHLFSASVGRSPALGWLGCLREGGPFEFWDDLAHAAGDGGRAHPGGGHTSGGRRSGGGGGSGSSKSSSGGCGDGGPFPLDLGDLLYAPNTLRDPQASKTPPPPHPTAAASGGKGPAARTPSGRALGYTLIRGGAGREAPRQLLALCPAATPRIVYCLSAYLLSLSPSSPCGPLPNLPQGRTLLWGWLSELHSPQAEDTTTSPATAPAAAASAAANPAGAGPPPSPADHAFGCISLPRVLSLARAPPAVPAAAGGGGGLGAPRYYLHSRPLPELAQLRRGSGWLGDGLRVEPRQPRWAACLVACAEECPVSLVPCLWSPCGAQALA
jgi:hypothetical protein